MHLRIRPVNNRDGGSQIESADLRDVGSVGYLVNWTPCGRCLPCSIEGGPCRSYRRPLTTHHRAATRLEDQESSLRPNWNLLTALLQLCRRGLRPLRSEDLAEFSHLTFQNGPDPGIHGVSLAEPIHGVL